MTTIAAPISSCLVDQFTFFNSVLTSFKNLGSFFILPIILYSPAGEAGVEPATPGFGDRCSSQLSYSPCDHRTTEAQKITY